MWCAACRADVAAELSADNRRMLCARCHSELGTAVGALERPVSGPRLQDTERNARELLARWSTQHLLEPPLGPGAAHVTAAGSSEPRTAYLTAEATSGKPAHRFDAPHSAVPAPIASQTESSHERGASADDEHLPERRRHQKMRPRLAPVAHEELPPPPPAHDDLVRIAVQQPAPRGNWTSTIGQLCAYGGVGVLTLGTVMVLSGYFGVQANFAPTGWLIAAVGQMLLFLGVVTLVSGGMEQTVDEVSWRIDHLAEQIMHLEQVIVTQQSQLEESQRRDFRRKPSPGRDQADAA